MSVNGSAEYLTAADLSAITQTQLTTFLRQPGGGAIYPNQETVSGATIGALVTLLGLSPGSVEQVVVGNGTGSGDQVLSHDEIDPGFPGFPGSSNHPADPCSPHCQAMISTDYSGGKTAQFSRPARAPDDLNGNYAGTPDGNVLAVAITTTGGSVIGMSATVSDPGPAAGAAVHFDVTHDAFPADTKLSWNFDDGTAPVKATGSDPAADHAFAQDGTYAVRVTAIAPDGSHGVASVAVQVGPVPTGDAAASSPQAATGNAAAGGGSGGNGSGGGSAATGSGTGGAKSASTGAATGNAGGDSTGQPGDRPKRRTGTTVPRRGDVAPTKGATTDTGAAPGASTTPGATTSAPSVVPATRPTPTPAGAASATSPASGAPRASTPPAATSGAASAGAGLIRISGLAVDGRGPDLTAALAAADALAAQAPPRSAARAAAGHGATIGAGATGALVIIGLLGLGAAREWRRLPKALPT